MSNGKTKWEKISEVGILGKLVNAAFEDGLLVPLVKKLSVSVTAPSISAWFMGALKGVLFIFAWPLQVLLAIALFLVMAVLGFVFALGYIITLGFVTLGYGLDIDGN